MQDPRRDDPDREEVRHAQAGDFGAFEVLVKRYQRRVYALAMRIVGQRQDAEEVAQQTFLSVVEHLDGFRGEALFGTWLMRIATNHALAVLRRRASHPAVPLVGEDRNNDSGQPPVPEFVAQWTETPEEIASRHETRQILTETLDRLDPKYSIVFVLRDLEDFSTDETAEVLQISPASVKVRLMRARLMLRERLTRRFAVELAEGSFPSDATAN
ncbi:MAG: sigma-70 family RNA polymerase sigma factor [Pirellulales bacterium]|nr:sigma-70 family RNA polymerase sigma factor [Pirellulales bacterium]